MLNALAIIFGRLGKQSDPCVAADAGRVGSSAIGAKAKRVANLRLLFGTGLIAALFGLIDSLDERLDLTQRIGIDAREAEVRIRRVCIQPGALAKPSDGCFESRSIARRNAHEVRIDVGALRRDRGPG